MDSKIIEELKSYSLFEKLPDDVVVELAGEVEQVSLKNNKQLFAEGDPGDSLYIIREGWVKIVNEGEDGKEVVYNHLGPGSVIGEMAILDQAPRSMGVVAISAVKMLKLGSEDFLKVLNQFPVMALDIIRNITKRLRFTTTYIENAIEWSQRIAAGDYSFAQEQVEKSQGTIVDSGASDRERANRFLGTFFRMVEDVKAREDELKQQLNQLKVEIDQARRKQSVEELTNSEFFKNLKSKSGEMRGNIKED
jgi:CRP-like cAMP-binding protein